MKVRSLAWYLVGPTGCGKGTQLDLLFQRVKTPQLRRHIGYVTRAPRPTEIPEVTKYFVTPERFQELREQDFFLEWNCVHGDNCYGTPRTLFDNLREDEIVCAEIDCQGMEMIRPLLEKEGRIIHAAYLWIGEQTCADRYRQRCEETGESPDQDNLEKRLQSLRRENVWAKAAELELPENRFKIFDGELPTEKVQQNLRRWFEQVTEL